MTDKKQTARRSTLRKSMLKAASEQVNAIAAEVAVDAREILLRLITEAAGAANYGKRDRTTGRHGRNTASHFCSETANELAVIWGADNIPDYEYHTPEFIYEIFDRLAIEGYMYTDHEGVVRIWPEEAADD